MIKVEQDFIDNLYQKARNSFKDCIADVNNRFLREEIDFQIDETRLVDDYISFKFFKAESNRFLIEVKLQLFSPGNIMIGKYFYYEDENGLSVDDSLIFD
ncbi:hypothetical protein [Pedobacter rhizosphaerae]|uniref:Uncharacterized protein n=1 Tax=Pedobacter rhizosphaerae TaxID=390241 RepID=A0A1H9W772_9SPHI|nr:hypothetical protein [Pedobacter rhizosphaerae]SES29537.1 hypothetical protein SAMN04488023_1606 [Pedobacter rhizosphaerae]